MPNLYGDILSDVAAQIAGSVGLAGSANVGDRCAMFEAIHGSAPRRAGQNLANPSGLLLGGVMMLVHIGQPDVAERVHNAWLRTIEDGIHTYDIYEASVSRQKVGTKEFAEAVVARLGQKPEEAESGVVRGRPDLSVKNGSRNQPRRRVGRNVGVDLYLDRMTDRRRNSADALKKVSHEGMALTMIDNRGTNRVAGRHGGNFRDRQITGAASKPAENLCRTSRSQRCTRRSRRSGYDIVKIENLRTFDGQQGFTLAQGQ